MNDPDPEYYYNWEYSNSKSVRVDNTPVGKGIFAERAFPAGAVIGEIEGDVIDDENYGSDYSFDIGDGFQLEPYSPFRFVNHGCEPNCEFDWLDPKDSDKSLTYKEVYLIAMRDIQPGEELLIDYNWPADSAIRCQCKAATCRGWVVDEDELPNVLGAE